MADAKAPKAKVKRSSAQKRNLQSQRRRIANRSFRSEVLTAIRGVEKALSQKESTEILKDKLSGIYKLVDKGVKKGVYKQNKAARVKSRLALKVS